MRKDLDTVRERHIARETRSELGALGVTDWGWVDLYAAVGAHHGYGERVATGEELAMLDPQRPGTADGGF